MNIMKTRGVFPGLDRLWREKLHRKGIPGGHRLEARRTAGEGGRRGLVCLNDGVTAIRLLPSRGKSLLPCPCLPYTIHPFYFMCNSIFWCCLNHLPALNIVPVSPPGLFYTMSESDCLSHFFLGWLLHLPDGQII